MTVGSRPIRPTPDFLRGLPTLAVETPNDGTETVRERARELGIDFRLELKLETRRARFWLCTQGADAPGRGPDNWVVGYVTAESREADEAGDYSMIPYGPDQVKTVQKTDYVNMLREELDVLLDRDEATPSWEVKRQIDAVRKELNTLISRDRD
jgi:hypothetical protein